MAQYRDRTFGKFDAAKPLVAKRQMTLLGNQLAPGDAIPEGVGVDVARRLWMSHFLTYAEDYRPTPEQETHGAGREWMDEADGVSVTEGENGWFLVQAAWLGEGEKVHGAEAAEARAAEVRAEGDDKGITYAHSGGGWYLITGPGVPDDTKVKGEEAAKARVAELRAAAGGLSAVTDTDALVVITVEDDEYVVTAPWLEAPERFADAEAADLRQKALRAEGPPQGWTPSAEDAAGA